MSELSLKPNHNKDFRRRIFIILIFIFVSFLVIVFRTGYIQIVQGKALEEIAQNYQQKPYPAEPFRGIIYDRNGNPLVDSKPAFKISLVPYIFDQDPQGVEKLHYLAEILKREDLHPELSTEQATEQLFKLFIKRLQKAREKIKKLEWNANEPVVLLSRNATIEQISWIKEQSNMRWFPWIRESLISKRIYPLKKNLAHILGYTNMISEQEWDSIVRQNKHKSGGRYVYRFDSEIGARGIEKKMDVNLRGIYGEKYRLLDARGRSIIQEIDEKTIAPIPGDNIYLTIDRRLQDVAFRALGDKQGVVIVSKPSTGEILAMVSSPCFNPNNLNLHYKEYLLDDEKPLINRAIQSLVPPASLFKLVVAAAAIESGKWNPNSEVICNGSFRLGRHTFACMGHHGTISMLEAIKKSCNVYFYNVGNALGWDTIYTMCQKFGLGSPTGLDISNEEHGILPNDAWKRERFGEKWYGGDTVVASIGQGYLLFTPIQVHNIVSAIANNGMLQRPYVIDRVQDAPSGTVIYKTDPAQRRYSPEPIMSQRTIKFLQRAMREVTKQGGTAYWYAGQYCDVQIAGKTGTGQTPKGEPHAWFTSFAPYDTDNPEDRIAITVLLEHGGAGGANAAPIAAAIYKSYFEHRRYPSFKFHFAQGALLTLPYSEKKPLVESLQDLGLEYIPSEEEVKEDAQRSVWETSLVLERQRVRELEQIMREWQENMARLEMLETERERYERLLHEMEIAIEQPTLPEDMEPEDISDSEPSTDSTQRTTQSPERSTKPTDRRQLEQQIRQMDEENRQIQQRNQQLIREASSLIGSSDGSSRTPDDESNPGQPAVDNMNQVDSAQTDGETNKSEDDFWNIEELRMRLLRETERIQTDSVPSQVEQLDREIEQRMERNRRRQEQIEQREVQIDVESVQSNNELVQIQEQRAAELAQQETAEQTEEQEESPTEPKPEEDTRPEATPPPSNRTEEKPDENANADGDDKPETDNKPEQSSNESDPKSEDDDDDE